MAELIEWLPDGTPYSPRYGDRYRSELGGLAQSREVFLHGCGLPAAWAGLPQWRMLETGFGLGLNFLVTWQAWKADPARPRLLHFVSTEAFPASAADMLRAAAAHPELLPLATQLQAQCWGLLPGVHRLVFEEGRVLLSLCIGDTQAVLREQQFEADSVYLDGFSPSKNPDIWNIHTLKAVARCCRRGTRIASWTIARSVLDGLSQCGFTVRKVPGQPPKRDNLQGEFDPRWEPRKAVSTPHFTPTAASSCVVIGAGLAGASVAASLARRGWQVEVLDSQTAPAGGASGLPAGVLVPHISPDDSLLSRLSRCGVRATWQQAEALLQAGTDWQACGVLERRLDGSAGVPADWPDAGRDWSDIASEAQLTQAGLSTKDGPACWHRRAGWIKPARLVLALLRQPGIRWRGGIHAARLQRDLETGQWQVLDLQGRCLVRASMVVLAAGHASRLLMEGGLPLQAIRGQMSWGLHDGLPTQAGFPPFVVNGSGSFIPAVPTDEGLAWFAGATFERDQDSTEIRPSNQQANLARLQALLPTAAQTLTPIFQSNAARAWAGVRCAAPDRLPLVGQVEASAWPGLWVSTAMGSRGLSFAVLCGELLAARLHGEPLPVEQRLAQALSPQRFRA
ncbi:MAG: FAD-dependent 5-carboxymethylaminomethyl-2-thiouridine(34) oxidoreductase MnmC [Polaromonas sp.]|uniref:FAD-dependent 5-carboxymethylaminomethyl-2-thiouridine(34) oxidoreductase MnmC n=1 Tax=Polaromonas sp. TaxID=1869339 RepID=UPI00272F10F6|nr:FAD-dependent 5-carboxymethylaminomethyl-2-thiouridine(34) oxidoreductase MnmC [Polaromonas sp.]MDP1741816.1 FAD-dependent 5-carboxymethylaminomethyl-2-thiouridine(34) oxidoreductase MnmC [Polaromonas sp.]MDP2033069.1 FAD-dependent 5-carboxymethylaminomethyl-2-thiouridine(34) oxidoreductase MnmC [Polaromonas sp.]MDP3753717.1 FAD-dependent 5-carboxymethylaminomethyl-2-thiouridine(34) oxidoreductase MnmC [Polaromonas sp.]